MARWIEQINARPPARLNAWLIQDDDGKLLPVQQMLPDGSWLSVIVPPDVPRAVAREHAIQVRVLEYARPAVDRRQTPGRNCDGQSHWGVRRR